MKSDLELYYGIIISFCQKLFLTNENSEYFQKGTMMYTFYVNIFPYIKFISFLVVFVVIFVLIRNLLSIIFKKGN